MKPVQVLFDEELLAELDADEQVQTVDKARLQSSVAHLPTHVVEQVCKALAVATACTV